MRFTGVASNSGMLSEAFLENIRQIGFTTETEFGRWRRTSRSQAPTALMLHAMISWPA